MLMQVVRLRKYVYFPRLLPMFLKSNDMPATSDVSVLKVSQLHDSSYCVSLIISSKGFVCLD